MATFIHGIGASENIDTSGEIVSIAGLDISSLDKDGVFNWEHKADQPSQVVGKILKARKIFSDADCEDDHQLAFWNKCKTPYLYVMGELLDDYSDSAREVAGKFRYDADHNNEKNMMNFSVEGSKISKDGITVSRSIARKITITVMPCNKAAIAEMVAVKAANPKKSAVDELFKTESVEIEVLTLEKSDKLWNLLKKEDPAKHAAKLGIKPFEKSIAGVGPTSAPGLLASEDMKKAAPKLAIAKPSAHARGNSIGKTKAGHDVHSHGMVGDYAHFSHADHSDAAAHHQKASDASKDMHAKTHHANKARLHSARSHSLQNTARERSERSAKLATTGAAPKPNMPHTQKLHNPALSGTMKPPGPQKKSEMAKAMTAGSGMVAPDRLEGGAALAKENIKKSGAVDGPDSEEMEMIAKAGQSGVDPQNGHDPGTSAINKPLRSKDSRVQVTNPTYMVKNELAKASSNPKLEPKDHKVKDLQRQIDSGTYKPNAAKIGESMLNHPEKPLKGTKVQKSEVLQRAEADYANWEKREAFEQFMKARMPSLTKGEVQVIGQTMLLQKSLRQEEALKKVSQHSFISKKEK